MLIATCRTRRVCVAVLLSLVSAASDAAVVTPADRIKNGVPVREEASTASPTLEMLNVGETATTVDDGEAPPRWRKVVLSDGTTGFSWAASLKEVTNPPTFTTTTLPVVPTSPTTTVPPPTGATAPLPLLQAGHSVDWWFVFKFNAAAFSGCGSAATRQCSFGGSVQPYPTGYGQQFVYASSDAPTLQKGSGCLGETTTDPVGATFGEVYNGNFHYVIWNDQFYNDPPIQGCTTFCSAPWAHSKGMLAWNDNGDGLVLQVSTPSWPAAGSKQTPRLSDGNTLGCIAGDNDVKVSQHFFALKLTKADVVAVLGALKNASVVTVPTNPQIVNNGGPADVQSLVSSLGTQSSSTTPTKDALSTGVTLISKPSALAVPPWQMVSAELGGTPLRVATWWSSSKIYSTTDTTPISCWDPTLGPPGPVEIALSGQWGSTTYSLTGGSTADHNHAKIGVSTGTAHSYAVFGDMNQEGTLSASPCAIKQNARGGLFFAVDAKDLHDSVASLIAGTTAGTSGP